MESASYYAPKAFKQLSGFFCVYKPVGYTMRHLKDVVSRQLAADLCNMRTREPDTRVSIDGNTTEPMTVSIGPDIADNPLVVGPRYLPTDFKIAWPYFLGRRVSGICPLAIKHSCRRAYQLQRNNLLRTYHISGYFGTRTDTRWADGMVKYRGNYKFLKRDKLEQFLVSIQASHQKKVFNLLGVGMNSQVAYELAAKGLVRPVGRSMPIIYNIKCVNFDLPNFTLEVSCVNESEDYLVYLVVALAESMRTVGTVSSITCIRNMFFDSTHALLKKHWNYKNIMANIVHCTEVLDKNSHFFEGTLQKVETVRTPTMRELIDELEEDIDPEEFCDLQTNQTLKNDNFYEEKLLIEDENVSIY